LLEDLNKGEFMSQVPMSILPDRVSKTLSKPFLGIAEFVQMLFPHFNLYLKQSKINLSVDEFFAVAILNSIFFFIIFTSLFVGLFFVLNIPEYLIAGLFMGFIFSVLAFLRIVLGVQVKIIRKIKSIDSNLIFGLKVLIVEINAGLSLFDSVVLVAMHNLGGVSDVFKEISKRLNAGEKEEEVLKDIASKNPSIFLKKVLWQIISGLKSGSPLKEVLDESLLSLEREQKTQIIAYGSTLRVLTLVFMMMGVIIPAMGMAFLAVLDSLPGISLGIEAFWIFLGLVLLLQFMLIGLIKSKRPNLMGSI
jgi:flagellar protein FlaJ